jgi:hypothetical protein
MYTSFMASKSAYDFMYTFSLTILLKSDPPAASTAAMFLSVWAYGILYLRGEGQARFTGGRGYGLGFYPALDERPCILIQPDVSGAEHHPVRLDGLGEDGERGWGVGGLDFCSAAHVFCVTDCGRSFLVRREKDVSYNTGEREKWGILLIVSGT